MASTTIPGFGGTVIRPHEAGYDAARAIWNAMHDRRPALIARPRSAPDVAAAIRYARAEGLLIAVRGGGHSMPGHSVCDDGIVIDLRALNQVRVDPRARRAPGDRARPARDGRPRGPRRAAVDELPAARQRRAVDDAGVRRPARHHVAGRVVGRPRGGPGRAGQDPGGAAAGGERPVGRALPVHADDHRRPLRPWPAHLHQGRLRRRPARRAHRRAARPRGIDPVADLAGGVAGAGRRDRPGGLSCDGVPVPPGALADQHPGHLAGRRRRRARDRLGARDLRRGQAVPDRRELRQLHGR